MKLIPSSTLAEAWLGAAEHLRTKPEWLDTTVVLHIEEPEKVREADRAVANTLDAFLVGHDNQSHHTVAETIFPGYEYMRQGAAGVFNYYSDEIYPKIKAHPDSRNWGTYAQRLLRRTDRDGRQYNPLYEMIQKMKQKTPVKASYELGLGFDISTYDDDDDRRFRLGGPCLSHLSFKLINKKVHLTAVYRSHYYIHRAYGNLLGLARLQAFVAAQVDASTGPLACHSTMALLEHGKEWGWGKKDVEHLIKTCHAARETTRQQVLNV
ncbi:MAG: hypothetical protein U0441_30180 [Polyangiaceae bacterium]